MQELAAKMKILMGWDSSRRRGRLTLRQVARSTGLSHSYLWMLLSGARTNPTADTLERLADFFGTDVTYFHDRVQRDEPTEFRGRMKTVHDLVQQAEAEGVEAVGARLADVWELLRTSGPSGLAARAALAYTDYLAQQNEHGRAEEVLRELLARWRPRMRLEHELKALYRWALLAYEQHRFFEAVERMETCLWRLGAAGPDAGPAAAALERDVRYQLGIFYRRAGRAEDAVRAYERALELCPPEEKRDVAFIHLGLGRSHRDAGRLEEAVEHLSTALGMLTDVGDARRAGCACNDLGDTLCAMGRWAEARARYEAGLLAHRMAGCESGVADAQAGIARCQLELGEPTKALGTVNQALDGLRPDDGRGRWGDALLVRARVYMALERWDEAAADVRRARDCFYDRRMVPRLMRAIAVEAELHGRTGALEKGAAQLREAAELLRGLGERLRLAGHPA